MIAPKLDFSSRPQHSLPRKSHRTMQHSDNLPGRARITGSASDRAITRNLAPRNFPDRGQDATVHGHRSGRDRAVETGSSKQRSAALGEKSLACHPKHAPKHCSSYAAFRNESSAASSLSKTSNTVSNLVTCSKSPTRGVRFASLMEASPLRAVM